MNRIAVLTSGGDAPGMNAALRSVVRSAVLEGIAVVGVQRGYEGLLEADFIPLPAASVSGIVHRGGTILRSARSEEFKTEQGLAKAAKNLRNEGIEALIVIGGNGTAHGAWELHRKQDSPVVQLPSSIDNDLGGTDFSIGFDTAVNTALDCVDKVRDTAVSHDRVFVVEVMGRDKGFIAVHVGLAAGAECIIIPEVPYKPEVVCEMIRKGRARGKESYIIVVAEGAADGGAVAADIQARTDADVRVTVLGHLQRGGSPTAFDRVLGSRLGAAGVQAALDGQFGKMIAVRQNSLVPVPIDVVWKEEKHLDLSLHELAARLAT